MGGRTVGFVCSLINPTNTHFASTAPLRSKQGKLYTSAFVMGPMLLTGTLTGSWSDEELQCEGGILQGL